MDRLIKTLICLSLIGIFAAVFVAVLNSPQNYLEPTLEEKCSVQSHRKLKNVTAGCYKYFASETL